MKGRIVIWTVVALLFAALLLLIYRSKSLKYNWEVNFETSHQPYDVDLLKEILSAGSGSTFRETDIPFHRWMYDFYDASSSFVFCGLSFAPDSIDAGALLDFVSSGNHAVISSQQFGNLFIEELEDYGDFNFPELLYLNDTDYVVRCSTSKSNINYILNYHGPDKMKYQFPFQYMIQTDSLPEFMNRGLDRKGNLNFFTVRVGEGSLTLHLTPLILTNYHLKNSEAERFAEQLFLTKQTSKVFWESRRSVLATAETVTAGKQNPFVYIFSQRALKHAFLLIITGVLIFIFFASKRKQKVIPIYVHPENTTLRFLENMKELHKLQPNYSEMARYRYLYFMHWLQKNYLIGRSDLQQPGFQARMQLLCKWETDEIARFVSNLKRLEANEPFSEIMIYHVGLQFERFYSGRN